MAGTSPGSGPCTAAFFTPLLASPVSNSVGGGPARPDRVGNGNLPNGERTIDRWFDIGAFATPKQFTFGNSGVRILEGPGYFNVDLALYRRFRVANRVGMSFRWELFNAFNRANFQDPNASIGTSAAGQISATFPARVMQLGMKVDF